MNFFEYFAVVAIVVVIIIAGICARELDKSLKDDE